MANNAIKQITIRRGNSQGGIDENTYNIGGSDSIDAVNVNYNDTVTQLGVSNVQRAIEQLKSNFQGGVDAVYNACDAKGSTPVSHSLSDVVAGIYAIPTGITPTGTFIFPANSTGDSENVYNYAYANATNVYTNGYNAGYNTAKADIVTIYTYTNYDTAEHEEIDIDTDIYTYTFPKDGTVTILYATLELTNHASSGRASGRITIAGQSVMYDYINNDSYTCNVVQRNQTYSVTAGSTIIIHKYVHTEYYDSVVGSMTVSGIYVPN